MGERPEPGRLGSGRMDRQGDRDAGGDRPRNPNARRIAKAISIRLGHEWEPSAEIATLLPIPMPDEISIEMFQGIVQGEMNGDAGYQRWADAESDEEVVHWGT